MANQRAVTRRVVSISISRKLLEAVDAIARGQKLKRSNLIERMIESQVEHERLIAGAFSNPHVVQAFSKAFSQPGMMKTLVAAMGEELTDEQLELFDRGLAEAMQPTAQAVVKAKSRRRKI